MQMGTSSMVSDYSILGLADSIKSNNEVGNCNIELSASHLGDGVELGKHL
jgi:hypothetical protein